MSNTQKDVVLGGRVFERCDGEDYSFDQFAWITTAQKNAGLDQELHALIRPALENALETGVALSDAEAQKLTAEIVHRCYAGRAATRLLAGMIVEKGRKWTHEGAEKTMEFLGTEVRGITEIEKMNAILAELVIAFFWNGLGSMLTSMKSSDLATMVAKLREESESDQDATSAISES